MLACVLSYKVGLNGGLSMATKNDPKNKAPRKKLIGACGHEVVPTYIKGVRGAGRMIKRCETCQTLAR
jgi:hypothetical protein